MKDIQELKQYLEKELPDFEYKTSDLPENKNKLWIERDDQKLVVGVQKVQTEKDAKKLKEFIELKWRGVK